MMFETTISFHSSNTGEVDVELSLPFILRPGDQIDVPVSTENPPVVRLDILSSPKFTRPTGSENWCVQVDAIMITC